VRCYPSAGKAIISVFPDNEQTKAIDAHIQSSSQEWKHISITGTTADKLLSSGEQVRQALGESSRQIRFGQDISERLKFSECAIESLLGQVEGRCLIVSPSLVPFDLVSDDSGFWGERYIFSHVLTGDKIPTPKVLKRVLFPVKQTIDTYLLLCPMAMDRPLARHLQDIVTVALSFEQQMPVELWLQPSLDRAMQGLKRTDVSWLHIDTHGDKNGQLIMLGPSRGNRDLVDGDAFPESVRVPLVMVVGCGLTAKYNSIGSVLFERGAQSVFGPCTVFQSLGIANSEDEQAKWYRTFFSALLDGEDIGVSLLNARRAIKGGILKHAWLIIGSSLLSFEREWG